jgi:hypothetical protein
MRGTKKLFMKWHLMLAVVGVLSSAAYADTMAWDVTETHQFGTANLTTGEFTQIGDLGFTPAGLGQIGQNLYTADGGGTTLYSINQYSGAATAIGTSSISYYAFGSTTSGLYMVDTVGGLWNINASTGQSTLIGSTELMMGNNSVALSTGSNMLYIALGSNIYTINTMTGLASYIGTSGGTDFGALVTAGGTVYASTVVAPSSIYTFNPATGTSTFSTLAAGDYSFGLAPVVPEPGTVGLLGLAGSLLTAFAWKRRKASL